MTDKSAPNGIVDPLEMSNIVRYGANTPGWVVPEGSDIVARYSRLDDNLGGFDIEYSGSSLTVTISSGEFFAEGHWGGRDVPTDIELSQNSETTIYAGIPFRETDRVIIGEANEFPDDYHAKVELWEVNTDDGGVVSVNDLRLNDPIKAQESRESAHIDLKDLGPGESIDQMLYLEDSQVLRIWEWQYLPNNQRYDRPLSISLIDENGDIVHRSENVHSSGDPLVSATGDNFYRVRIQNESDDSAYYVGGKFIYSITQ